MNREKLQAISEKLFVENYSRHVLLCVGDGCCAGDAGKKSWNALKDELKARGLTTSPSTHICYRTKVECLRICTQGPILVVYPEGYWYAQMTQDKISEFVERQIVAGEPIKDWIFARNCSSSSSSPTKDSQIV